MARQLALPLAFLAALTAVAGACERDDASGAVPAASGTSPGSSSNHQTWSFIRHIDQCDVRHRGLLLDFGGTHLAGRFGSRLLTPPEITNHNREGASWGKIYIPRLHLRFLTKRREPLRVALRVQAGDSRRLDVSLDGYLLSTVRLAKDGGVASTRRTSKVVAPGLHTLELRFRGRRKDSSLPYAEIDWVNIGPDKVDKTYRAPTNYEVLLPKAHIGGVPHEAFSVSTPGSVACGVRIPHRSILKTSIGVMGPGTGRGTIVLRRDGMPDKMLKTVDVAGGAEGSWTDIEVPLDAFAGSTGELVFMAAPTTDAGRLLFGDPALITPQPALAKTPIAKRVVVIVLDGVDRTDLPPWRAGSTPHVPRLSALAKEATVFEDHRASSTLVSASVASLITGLAPWTHTVADSAAQLPKGVATLGLLAKDSSIRGTMFTGVPSTFDAFGFSNHWDDFRQFPPNGGARAVAPIKEATQWLLEDEGENGRPSLAVIHARGGHPPWDITDDQAKELPPKKYTGYLGPRRSAQLIAKVGGRENRMSSQDRDRMRSMYFAGLWQQDKAIGELIEALKDAGRWDDTLLIVTGDASLGPSRLFIDGSALSEETLGVPLYVHFPRDMHSADRFANATETADITKTLLVALGIKTAENFPGRDLASVASHSLPDTELVRVAQTDDKYSAQWGEFALLGTLNKRPKLCVLPLDPQCISDRTGDFPIATQTLFRRVALVAAGGKARHERVPLRLDSNTAGMLKVWGSY